MCQPARASLLTGFLPHSHGVCDNGIDLEPARGKAGFAGQLAKAGYRTALVGKGHYATRATFEPNDSPESNHGSTLYGADWFGPYMGFQHVELAHFGHLLKGRRNPRPPQGHHFERWYYSRLPNPDDVERLWDEELPPSTGATQTWNSGLPSDWHTSSWVGDRSVAYRQQQAADEPFCLWASFPDPHHPFDCPEPWYRLHPPEDIDLPEHRTLDLDQRPGGTAPSPRASPRRPTPSSLT